jgi:hypothetical protein
MRAELPVAVELPRAWAMLPDQSHAAAVAAIAAAVDSVLNDFGIAAQATVTVSPVTTGLEDGSDAPRIHCNGWVCCCAPALGARVLAHVERTALRADHFSPPATTPGNVRTDAESNAKAIRHLAILCAEGLKQHPARLLGPPQVAACADRLREHGIEIAPADMPGFARMLRRLLEQRIGLADADALGRHWLAGRAQRLSPEQMAESLIDAYGARPILIRAARRTLRDWTLNASPASIKRASGLRDEAYFALGVAYPDFRFEIDEALAPGAFRFEIQALRTLPVFGLEGADRIEAVWLPAIESGAALLHPATLRPYRRVDRVDDASDGADRAIDAMGYMLSCLGEQLQSLARCFVRRADVAEALNRATASDTVLARALHARHGSECVTEVLRLLVAERVSIRNLRRIAESLCSFDHVVVDATSLIVFDPRLPVASEPDARWLADPRTLVEFVRTGLKAQLAQQLGAGDSIGVYLLEPEVERALAAAVRAGENADAPPRLTEPDESALWRGLRIAIGASSSKDRAAVLLTTVASRARVQEYIKDQYPEASVLSYSELPVEMSIQPIARVGFAR